MEWLSYQLVIVAKYLTKNSDNEGGTAGPQHSHGNGDCAAAVRVRHNVTITDR